VLRTTIFLGLTACAAGPRPVPAVSPRCSPDSIGLFAVIPRDSITAATPYRWPSLLSRPSAETGLELANEPSGATALIELVIDTVGRAEPGSLQVLQSSSPELAQRASRLAYEAQYSPAEVAGRKVRMCLRIPFKVAHAPRVGPAQRRPNHDL
jgi:hypothetical protein